MSNILRPYKQPVSRAAGPRLSRPSAAPDVSTEIRSIAVLRRFL